MSTRRRFKARRVIAVTTAVAAAAATAVVTVQFASADESGAGARQSCQMTTLPIPEGLLSTSVSGMSDDGSVIAYYALPLDQSWPDGLGAFPRLYADGEVTEVPMPGDHPRIHDVNSSGTGAGYTQVGTEFVPYVWRDGELVELPSEEGGQAHGINEAGDIVGGLESAGRPPALWPADGSGPVELALPEHAEWGMATSINDDGVIVGYYSDDSGSSTPYVWQPDGTGAELPLPEGITDAHAVPTETNGDWASGLIIAQGHEANGIRWNLAEGTADLTDLDYMVAVSADGTVAGHLTDGPTAAYQTGEAIVELPGAVDPADNLSGDDATSISADGSLLAGNVWVGLDEGGLNIFNAVTWTCE